MKQTCEKFHSEINRTLEKKVRGIQLNTPDTGTLAEIVAAGPGEHQNRIWTRAVKHSVGEALRGIIGDIDAQIRMHVASDHAGDASDHGRITDGDFTRWLS